MNHLARGLAIVGLLAVVNAAQAATAPTVTRHSLPSGLTVLVREDRAAGVVAASLQVRAGSLFETPETAGITNLLHRVMVRGTSTHSAQQLAEAAEDLGGNVEAAGDVEYGEVRGQALARNWEPLLGLIAQVALHPTLPQGEIDKERRLVASQLRTRADTPFQRAYDTVIADLYGGHPYRWHSLGRRESVEGVTREALRAHYDAIYRPDRMVLALSGNVPRAQVVKAAERLFRTLDRPAGPRAPVAATAESRGEPRLVERPAQQAQVLVAYLGPPLLDPDFAATRLLGTVLGGGMSGRLFQELREKRGLAYSVGVIGSYRTGPSFLLTYLGTAPSNTEAAVAAVMTEIDRVRGEGVSERELQRAKAYLLGSLAMDRRTNARHAWYLAFFEVIGAGWQYPERFARGVETATAADLARVAQRYLVKPSVVVLRPAVATP